LETFENKARRLMRNKIVLKNLGGEKIRNKQLEFLHQINGSGETIEKNIAHPIIVGKTTFYVFSLSLTHKTHIATDRMSSYIVRLVDKKDEPDEQLTIIDFFNKRLGNRFKFRIVGAFEVPLEELDEDDEKYVQLVRVSDEASCYIDWCYDEFDIKQLQGYVDTEDDANSVMENRNIAPSILEEYKELFKLLKIALNQWKTQ
jgi:hypothetical protein